MKDCNILDTYEISFSEFEETADGWPLMEHGAIVNYLIFRVDTIARKRKTPSFTDAYPNYGRLPRKYPNCGKNRRKKITYIYIFIK